MTIRNRITEISLWVFIISLGILIGATVFEALVITPLWAGSPPESVRGWNENPRYAIESGIFFGLIAPVLLLSTLVSLIAPLSGREPERESGGRCLKLKARKAASQPTA